MSDVVLQFADAGRVHQIEAARSGTFKAMGGIQVDLTPERLSFLARHFDSGDEHKVLVGHKLETDTPDYGDVVGLEYHEGRDRLLAGVRPTELLVEKNRKAGFRRVSMELDRLRDGNFQFRNLAFLAAHRPAIHGLEPVALARGEVLVCAAADELTDLQLADLVRRGDVTAASPQFQFAYDERHERIRAYMLAHPEVSYLEAAVQLAQEEQDRVFFADVDQASLELHDAIVALIEKERLAGRTLTFLDAARRIEREQAAKGR